MAEELAAEVKSEGVEEQVMSEIEVGLNDETEVNNDQDQDEVNSEIPDSERQELMISTSLDDEEEEGEEGAG